MVGEAIVGLGALKTAFDMAKGLKDISDAAIRNAAVIELQEKILTAQQAQSALLEHVGSLEKQVASFEKWDAEKEKYSLQEIYAGCFAYAIKEEARGTQPAHLICAQCYEDRRKSVLQRADSVHLGCPICKTRLKYKDASQVTIRSRPSHWMSR
jgi:hypothetical protein